MNYFKTSLPSPVGSLTLLAHDTALVAVVWRTARHPDLPFAEAAIDPDHALLREAARQLGEYFAGRRREFDVPLDLRGTEFQRSVWAKLRDIPFGETRSYGELARQLGNPAAMRAVGAANGGNPVSIIVPCHRVIGASGSLTGFGGGLDAKAWLLAHESPQRDLLAAG